ncbi:MAG: tRNA (adenosine(37)-N6)-dimethylallyltransferase MiaA [Candidatus Omnitrophica bacterium]|nr:tRNA (adenosine(37)-N6)-dimethylallyltransferase MiaA [Candidatus Omnitrophota bacterium]
MKPLVFFLLGPTAVGKSKIAVELAKRLKGEIISADSMQVYRGMDIGTAKPSKKDQKQSPHHLIDILSPARSFSAFEYRKKALAKIRQITRRKRTPMVVGGSGLYVRSLLEGISGQPGANWKIRRKLEREAKIRGLAELYRRLERLDSMAAKKIKASDEMRIIRALEIREISGKNPSQWHQKKEGALETLGFQPVVIGICRPRPELYENINARVDEMFRKGLVREVKKLAQGRLSRTARLAVGYKEILKSLAGEISLQAAKEDIKKNSRHLAKRQITWFKKEKGIHWVEWEPNDTVKTMGDKILMQKQMQLGTEGPGPFWGGVNAAR